MKLLQRLKNLFLPEGEIYFKKYGEIMMDVVDKKKARREAKKHIENELQDQL